MYSKKPSFVYGFHGLDKEIAIKILNQEIEFEQSHNLYDWLGDGIYFWENNFERAEKYAIEDSKRSTSKIKTPFALGAVLDLGNCFDLLEQRNLDFLKFAYDEFAKSLKEDGEELPENTNFGKNDFDFKNRELDCAVIRYAHELAKKEGMQFDSVRAAFWEGELIYPNASFKSENHIQIAILNPNCIKGIFLPRFTKE
ncbi:MAG: hypothetical protein NT094_00170 [Candidatus Staskawiczbacteria bacterium]|nr:hypothetical protein [Candidatus Staskawiczbacteria bacterium]